MTAQHLDRVDCASSAWRRAAGHDRGGAPARLAARATAAAGGARPTGHPPYGRAALFDGVLTGGARFFRLGIPYFLSNIKSMAEGCSNDIASTLQGCAIRMCVKDVTVRAIIRSNL